MKRSGRRKAVFSAFSALFAGSGGRDDAAVQQMPDGEPRVARQHPRPGEAHDGLDALPPGRLVAVDRAAVAGRKSFLECGDASPLSLAASRCRPFPIVPASSRVAGKYLLPHSSFLGRVENGRGIVYDVRPAGKSSNGRTHDSGSWNQGSNPCFPALKIPIIPYFIFFFRGLPWPSECSATLKATGRGSRIPDSSAPHPPPGSLTMRLTMQEIPFFV